MDWKLLATVFGTVFLAELGDKTQLATMLFAADGKSPKWQVFLAASAALVATTAIGVLAGALIAQTVSERALRILAGAGFLAIGGLTLWDALRS